MIYLEAVLKPGFVAFVDYFGRFSTLFVCVGGRGVYQHSYTTPKKESKRISKGPENR